MRFRCRSIAFSGFVYAQSAYRLLSRGVFVCAGMSSRSRQVASASASAYYGDNITFLYRYMRRGNVGLVANDIDNLQGFVICVRVTSGALLGL